MTLGGIVWNRDLDIEDREAILRSAYPNRLPSLIGFESHKKWQDLLPSTQKDLLDYNWSVILGRDVQPD